MSILESFIADHPETADKTYGLALSASLRSSRRAVRPVASDTRTSGRKSDVRSALTSAAPGYGHSNAEAGKHMFK